MTRNESRSENMREQNTREDNWTFTGPGTFCVSAVGNGGGAG